MIDIVKYEQWNKEPFAACEDSEVPVAHYILDFFSSWKPTRILDVGCGTGVYTKWFNENVCECVGITINEAEIKAKVHPLVQFGNMLELPFEDCSFDLVFCLGTIEHTIAPFIAFVEFNRVLPIGGFLYFNYPSIEGMEILDRRYTYHKSILFPIQVRDYLLKTGFELISDLPKEEIEGPMYRSYTHVEYIVKKVANFVW